MNIVDRVETLRESFTVPDLISPSAKYLFVLESPHIQELAHGAPVSGSSGKIMARHLLGDGSVALGIRLKTAIQKGEYPVPLENIGLVNICPIPMQSKAYPPEIQTAYQDVLPKLNDLRRRKGSGRYQDPDLLLLQEWIVDLLKKRLRDYDHQDITWIPCGKFAQKFLAMASDVITNPVTIALKHPSMGGWDHVSSRSEVKCMKKLVLGQQ